MTGHRGHLILPQTEGWSDISGSASLIPDRLGRTGTMVYSTGALSLQFIQRAYNHVFQI